VTAALYAVIFLALGIVLMAIEMTLIPGFGLVGALGVASMIYGGFVAWTEFGPMVGVAAVAGGGLIAVATFVLVLRSGWSKRMILRDQVSGQPSELPGEADTIVGATGVTVSALRPAGFARFDGRRLDVIADDGVYLDAGVAVVAVRVAQNSVIVQEWQAAAQELQSKDGEGEA
jgi:membrane-bound serine protease (ClpP class)